MSKTPPLVVGLGEILWDMLPAGRQLGGAPANFTYHAGALGARGAVVSRVGSDALGREILEQLDALKLDRAHVSVDTAHPTGVVDVTLEVGGVPQYVIRTDVAWDFVPIGIVDVAPSADAVCYGTLALRGPVSRESILAFIRATRRDCLRVFDINLRQHYYSRELIVHMLRCSNVLKINDQELATVATLMRIPSTSPPEVARIMMLDYPIQLIALTRGPDGSTLFHRDGQVDDHGACPGEIVDTVAAGDAFTAALVLGLLEGHPLQRINAFANRLAGFVCSKSGATPPIPEILKAMR